MKKALKSLTGVKVLVPMLGMCMTLFLAGCSDGTSVSPAQLENRSAFDMAQESGEVTGNLVETAVAAASFNTLVTALQVAGLDEVLADGSRRFTVFAPTDTAFEKLGTDAVNALLNDVEALKNILLYHVLPDSVVDAELALSLDGEAVTAANGDNFDVSVQNGKLFINTSEVTATDIFANNGVIHVIDTVLLPPENRNDSGVDDQSPGTILEVARAAGFNTLVAAVEATGLDSALGHPDDLYTVFAPTDEAFALLGTDTINSLLADPHTLRNILLLHVIPGTVIDVATAVSLVGFDIQAGSGNTLRLEQSASGLTINGANIIVTDVAAKNGIIHVIDAVLLP